MHMKGMPSNMQVNPLYKNAPEDILEFLSQRVDFCLSKGLTKEQLMIDPGIGFGKTLADNLSIINRLYIFKQLGVPVFIGVSRKSFVGKILNANVQKRLIGTIAASVLSFARGADVLRVHDVRETRQALKVAYQIMDSCRIS